VISLFVIGYSLLSLVAFVFGERVIFQPPPASYDVSDLPFRRIGVGGGDSVAVLHLPNDSARYTILYSHGNAEDLGYLVHVLRILHGAGFGVIAYDYRGYGRSTGGRPTVRMATADAETVYQFAVNEFGLPPDRLILHGRSVGSGPTLELAVRHPVAGVILESAFTSTYRVLTRVGLLPFDRFRNIRQIENVRSPVLVIHGSDDRLISPSHGRTLFGLAPEPKQSLWVDGAAHNDVVRVAGEAYMSALQRFALLIEQGSAPDSAATRETSRM
jgi:fermentation-respiration switch protein FrsA (DUF1100 family)